MNQSGDSIRVVHPLFQAGGGGSIPTSPLQLVFGQIDVDVARRLLFVWHSRLPEISNWQGCSPCYGAECGGIWYAIAMWGPPVARMLNGRGWLELRRFAIAPDAPRNTASRMLSWMTRQVSKLGVQRAISYQDTAAHAGTIYRASGWKIGNTSEGGEWSRPSRGRASAQTASKKVRWEMDLHRPNDPR